MKKLVLLFSLISIITNSIAQTEYKCTPCGYDCDAETYKTPGTCAMCKMKLVTTSSIKFKSLSFEEFAKRIQANPNVVLLDVRSPEEFKGTTTEVPSFGHFKNAININVEELEARLVELSKYKDKEILVYCSHSHRSPRASYILNINGFNNVSNMNGGVSTLAAKQSNELLKKFFVFHLH